MILNKIFLLSLFDSTLLAYGKATDFYILILYPVALINSFINSNSFLVETLGFSFFNKFIYFIYLFLAELGFHCCVWFFSSCGKQGLLFVVVRRPLIAVTSPVEEHRLYVRRLW